MWCMGLESESMRRHQPPPPYRARLLQAARPGRRPPRTARPPAPRSAHLATWWPALGAISILYLALLLVALEGRSTMRDRARHAQRVGAGTSGPVAPAGRDEALRRFTLRRAFL